VGRFADLDCVTLDANGTLVGLVDPVPKLVRVLRERGVEREPEAVARAFACEGRHYMPRAIEGRDRSTLERLHRDCASVFLAEVEADLDPVVFAPTYIAAITFETLPGVTEALAELHARGLELAVVGNWDMTLRERLAAAGLAAHFSAIISAAEAGVAKPDPRIFELALHQIGARPERTLHIGDGQVDEAGARAAGMHFHWAPIPIALEAWR
jgi:putative hydrolase of the HAD superfamily